MSTVRRAFRNVCFTVNNPVVSKDLQLAAFTTRRDFRYAVVADEWGEGGTPHHQGYVEFTNCVTLSTLKVLIPKGHYEGRRGTAQQASDYCKKDGNFVEEGTLSSLPGRRTDIDAAIDAIRAGKRMREVAMEFPGIYVKYHKGLHRFKEMLAEPRSGPPEVQIYFGPTGSGKSRRAREWAGPDAYVWHPQQGSWFDSYENHNNVVFEEFRGQIPFGMLLSLLDRYDCRVQTKGGTTEFNALRIAITSPVHPKFWYKTLEDGDRYDQLERRVSKIIDCGELDEIEKMKARMFEIEQTQPMYIEDNRDGDH